MEAHTQLIGMKNDLLKKKKRMQASLDFQNTGINSDLTLDRIEEND